MTEIATEGQQRRWWTPTGEPCPRSLRLDGTVEGTGDCHGCGCCLLLAGLVEFPARLSDNGTEQYGFAHSDHV